MTTQPIDLASLSDDVLETELKRRKEEREKQEAVRRDQIANFISQHIDSLLLFAPEHSRSSCSDTNHCNHYHARCLRCLLLEIKETGFIPKEFAFSISATYKPTTTDKNDVYIP